MGVLIEDVTFTGSAITGAGDFTSNGDLTMAGALSGVTTLGMSGVLTTTNNIVMSNSANTAITHQGNTKLTISSGGKVKIESVTFTGDDMTNVGDITMSGALTATGTITSNDFFKTNNDKGIKGGEMTQAQASSCTGDVDISKWHGRIKIPGTCTLGSFDSNSITVDWDGSQPASFEDSTIMLSQCGSDTNTNTYQSATYRITIESSTRFKMQYANTKSGSINFVNTIICYVIIWGV